MKKSKSIYYKIFIPFMCFIVFQSIFYLLIMAFSGVFSNMKYSTYDVFGRNVSNTSLYLQANMLKEWSSLNDCEDEISDTIDRILLSNSKNIDDVASDDELNFKIIDSCTAILQNSLKKNQASGIYMLLNQSPEANISDFNSGIYIKSYYNKNFENTNSPNNMDSLLLRGSMNISKKYGILTDSKWSPTFSQTPSSDPFLSNLNQVFLAAKNNSKKISDVSLFGKWTYIDNPVAYSDSAILTYTIPIVHKNGQVIGVLGIDISDNMIKDILNYNHLDQNGNGYYCLATNISSSGVYRKAIVNGVKNYKFLNENRYVNAGTEVENDCFIFNDYEKDKIIGSVKNLNLYDSNSPFADEQWAVIGFLPKRIIESDIIALIQIISFIGVINLIMGIVLVFIVSKDITDPIKNLIGKLNHSDSKSDMNLSKINITEIDTLTSTLEHFSHSVTESASRIYKIIKMTEFPLGVYELRQGADRVFCSGSLFEIMGWENENNEDTYIPLRTFNRLLNEIYMNPYDANNYIYEISNPKFGTKWIKIVTQIDDNEVLGTINDVSQDVLSKKQILYERDYDDMTGILNRHSFEEKFRRIFNSASRGEIKNVAFLMADLDGLKTVNDTYGHEVGDKFIKTFSDTFAEFIIPEQMLLARRSGDEFYILFYSFESKDEILGIVDNFWKKLSETQVIIQNDQLLKVSASGGLAWFDQSLTSYTELTNMADAAMYYVKNNGRNSYKQSESKLISTAK
ncbi:MAG: diguanylate cyclase [Oscillospiraceae bacterium]